MKLIALSILISCFWEPFSCDKECVPPYNNPLAPDYYWREYSGAVPNDAIEGGLDDNGNITYIGQVLYDNALLPATIYAGQKAALFNKAIKIFYSDKYVKILCSQNKERFVWIQTTTYDMRLLTDYYLVIGGTEIDFVLNIGRVNFDQRVIIGKIFSGRGDSSGLWIPKKDGKEEHLNTFQVLAYDLLGS